GLTLGIGLLVDNAIVVLENITRYRNQGYSVLESARLGTREIALAVTASTFTTVSVFLPLVYLGGFEGVLFRDQALTLSISLLASLLVALTVLPVLVMMVQRKKQAIAPMKSTRATRGMLYVQESYEKALDWSLNKTTWVFLTVFVGLVIAVVL